MRGGSLANCFNDSMIVLPCALVAFALDDEPIEILAFAPRLDLFEFVQFFRPRRDERPSLGFRTDTTFIGLRQEPVEQGR